MTAPLELLIEDGSNRRIPLPHGVCISVGRTDQAEIVVLDPQISSLHYTIVHGTRGYWLHDRDSTNGTSVNGQLISEVELRVGDVIKAGETTFTIGIPVSNTPAKNDRDLRGTVPSDASKSTKTRRDSVERTEPASTSSLAATATSVESSLEEGSSADNVGRLLVHCPANWAVHVLPWESRPGEAKLTIIAKATFTLERDPQRCGKATPILEEDLVADDDPTFVIHESDLVPFKPNADVLVIGDAVTPDGRPMPQLDVSVRVGPVAKTVRVFGNRRWSYPTRAKVVPTISAPEPFRTMPITFNRAYGGIDTHAAKYCDENLSGTGFIGSLSPASIHEVMLPNIESPDHLITSWDTRPRPAGLGCVSRNASWRRQFAGTYDDESYRDPSRMEPPTGRSWSVHNCAPPEMQLKGYLRGGEPVELVHLTDLSPCRFSLPTLSPSTAVSRLHANGSVVDEAIRLDWDTLLLRPQAQVFDCVFRAVVPIASLEDPDIVRVTLN